jgi:nicotinamidase-related amidase
MRSDRSHHDLHGNAPDKSPVALLMIDVINDLDFPGNQGIVKHAGPMAQRIATLKQKAKAAEVPVIYINDNFGRWRSDFTAQVNHCLQEDVPGKPVAKLLKPEKDDYFVLKPKHSGFFSTTLDILLDYLQVQTLVLTGIAGNICVLFTAHDAYLRDFRLLVPRDCVVSNTKAENMHALDQMQNVLKADIRPSTEIDFESLK